MREFALTFDQKNQRVKLERTVTEAPDQTVRTSSPEQNEFVGNYGARSISFEDGAMFLQRQGRPRLRLVEIANDEYTLEVMPAAQVKFVRDASGKIVELRVLNREGQWEGAKKDRP